MRKFWKNERGQGMVEYILIVALIAVAAIVTVRMFGGQIKDLFTSAGTQISDTKKDMGVK